MFFKFSLYIIFLFFIIFSQCKKDNFSEKYSIHITDSVIISISSIVIPQTADFEVIKWKGNETFIYNNTSEQNLLFYSWPFGKELKRITFPKEGPNSVINQIGFKFINDSQFLTTGWALTEIYLFDTLGIKLKTYKIDDKAGMIKPSITRHSSKYIVDRDENIYVINDMTRVYTLEDALNNYYPIFKLSKGDSIFKPVNIKLPEECFEFGFHLYSPMWTYDESSNSIIFHSLYQNDLLKYHCSIGKLETILPRQEFKINNIELKSGIIDDFPKYFLEKPYYLNLICSPKLKNNYFRIYYPVDKNLFLRQDWNLIKESLIYSPPLSNIIALDSDYNQIASISLPKYTYDVPTWLLADEGMYLLARYFGPNSLNNSEDDNKLVFHKFELINRK